MEEKITLPEVSSTPEVSVQPPKKNNLPKVILSVILGLVVVAGAVYAGVKIGKKQIQPNVVAEPTIVPTTIPQETEVSPAPGETINWKTYRSENVTFKYPLTWVEDAKLIRGSGFSQVFRGPEGKLFLTFSSNGNYNQLTGEPYATIDEFVGMPYQVKPVIVDGQEGRQPLPRAGSENINRVVFFSKDPKFIYELELQAGNTALDTSEAEVLEGQKIFDQILSTFKFTE